MDVKCSKCKAQFKIADEKLPPGKLLSVPCPKCKERIPIDTRKKAAANGGNGLADEVHSAGYNADDRPFDYVEHGAKTALLCESDTGNRATLRSALTALNYKVTEPTSARDALKQMRFHVFDLVVVNERFETDNPSNNHVLKYLGRQPIAIRRTMFVALLSKEFRTNDHMAAYTKSVNVVISLKNINEVGNILQGAISENEVFYKIFMESMDRAGKL